MEKWYNNNLSNGISKLAKYRNINIINGIASFNSANQINIIDKQNKTILLDFENCIIATGGGIVENYSNIEIMKNTGKIIWLRASPKQISKRDLSQIMTRFALWKDQLLHINLFVFLT